MPLVYAMEGIVHCDDHPFINLVSQNYRWKWFKYAKYHKIPKYSDTQKIAVMILKFEHCGSNIE